MSSKIRPSIYIGIGGTGVNAVAKTKKMFEDSFGKEKLLELPIRFVCLDYDKTAKNDPRNATDISDDFIEIKNIANPKDTYNIQSQNGKYKWFFPQNVQFMDDKVLNGAAQVRGYGRFLTEMIMDSIEAKLQSAYKNVKSIQQTLTDETREIHTVDCHIVMSIAGGTGCGSFLNIAWALRQLFRGDVNIIGYGVLYSVFRAMDVYGNQTPRVVSNSYSAILDLDYLMSPTIVDPITVTMNGKEEKLTSPLYNQFYVIDNETENGKVVKDCNSLCEAIGTCLFSAGTAVGDKVDSILSNVHWQKGHQYNISPKNGWAQGLGACQVIYNGSSLADIYADKAAIELIKQLRDEDSDIVQRAITWTETARVREDGDAYNLLIDSIYGPDKISKVRMPNVDVKDSIADIKNAVNRYLSVLPDFPSDTDIEKKEEELQQNLSSYLVDMLNNKNGVGNSKKFLSGLYTIISGYKGEMENESSEFIKSIEQTKAVLDERGYKEYEAFSKKLLKGKGAKAEELESNIAKPAQKILKNKLEAERRKVAYNIFSQLLSVIENLSVKVNALDDRLTKLSDEFEHSVLSKQKASTGNSLFLIDLSAQERVDLKLDYRDVHVNDFIASIDKSLLTMELNNNDLKDAIYHFTRNETLSNVDKDGNKSYIKANPAPFPKYDFYENRLLEDVISDLQKKDPIAYDNLKMNIDNLSSRLLTIDDRGMLDDNGRAPSQKLNRVYYICHYDRIDQNGHKIKSVFEKDRQFTDDDKVAFLPCDSDYFKQRMIFYRSDFAIIPYCIRAFSDYVIEKEYLPAINRSNSDTSDQPHPHYDKLLFEEMKKKDFKLKPEIKNEAMFYWVCGNILDFGWESFVESVYVMQKDENGYPIKIDRKDSVEHKKYIRFYKGKYQFYNAGGKSSGVDGNWITINTADRKNAFDRFKIDYLPNIKAALASHIKDELRSNGIGTYEQRIKELTEGRGKKFDYIDLIAVGNKNSAVLYSQRTQEATQYDEEWNYLVEELLNTLKNLK